jgi:hypothetical protein
MRNEAVEHRGGPVVGRRPRGHALAPLRHFWATDAALSILLGTLLLIVFVLYPLQDIGVLGHLLIDVLFTITLISGVVAVTSSPLWAGLACLFTIVALGLRWASAAMPAAELALWDAGSSLIVCALLAGIVLTQASREGPITVQRIQGAIAAYILIGLAFAFAYEVVALRDPSALHTGSANVADGRSGLTAELVYFSFITLTTLGYGDITPVHAAARSLSMLEGLFGQIFPVVAIARLVSLELEQRSQRRRTTETE